MSAAGQQDRDDYGLARLRVAASPLFLRDAEVQRGVDLLLLGQSHLLRTIDAALRGEGHTRPKSAAVFRRLGERVSFQRCSDPSFLLLLATLRGWFGTDTGSSPSVVSESDRAVRKLRRRPGRKGQAGSP